MRARPALIEGLFNVVEEAVSMSSASLPENERERLLALYEYDILDTPRDPLFDSLTTLAAQICEAPIAPGGRVLLKKSQCPSGEKSGPNSLPSELMFGPRF